MVLCTKCGEELPQDFAACSGRNSCCLHFGLCAGIQEATWRRSDRSSWKCQDCRKISAEPIEPEEMRNFMARTQKQLEPVKEISGLVITINELKESVDFASKQYEEIKNRMEKLEKDHSEATKTVKELQTAVKLKDEIILNLSNRMRETEQYARNRNIEISGLEEQKNEDLVKIVGAIAEAINVPFQPDDIDIIHRVPSRPSINGRGPPRVIAQFTSRKKRNEFLRNKRSAGPLMSMKVVPGGKSDEIVYLNTHLTAEWKHLLWRSKQVGKPLGYKVIWYQDNRIIAKRDFADTHPVYVTNDADLSKLQRCP